MDTDAVRGAVTRAEDLQDRLVRTAYALHFAADDVAALLDERAKVPYPARVVDTSTLAKRWRVVSEIALDIARGWDRSIDRPQAVAAVTGDVDLRPPSAGALAEAATRHLYAAELRIESVLPSVGQDVLNARLEEAAQDVREALQALRTIAVLVPRTRSGQRH